jgi:hypothetical protein
MKIFTLVIAVVLTCACAYAGDLNPNFTKVYETSKGDVTFNHQNHAEVLQDCAACHSMFESFGGVVNKEYGHKGCKTCHKESGVKSVTICSGCHVR